MLYSEELPPCPRCLTNKHCIKVYHDCPYDSLLEYEPFGKFKIGGPQVNILGVPSLNYYCQTCDEEYWPLLIFLTQFSSFYSIIYELLKRFYQEKENIEQRRPILPFRWILDPSIPKTTNFFQFSFEISLTSSNGFNLLDINIRLNQLHYHALYRLNRFADLYDLANFTKDIFLLFLPPESKIYLL